MWDYVSAYQHLLETSYTFVRSAYIAPFYSKNVSVKLPKENVKVIKAFDVLNATWFIILFLIIILVILVILLSFMIDFPFFCLSLMLPVFYCVNFCSKCWSTVAT